MGGGITGAGTARDCAMRGLKVLLVERFDLCHGATGRNHGLLHSGARYAVTDSESAAECIQENTTLRRIARHCVEETDGLFITLPEDDLSYQDTFIAACHAAGINAKEIDPAQARLLEPAVNPALTGAVRVPDASIDPFRLTAANVHDAQLHGAHVLTYHEVVDLVINNGRVQGIKVIDHATKTRIEFSAQVIVNAAGIWGHLIARKAGININMFPSRGALLIMGHRINNMVINRCRKPANADILVPDDAVSVIGTTSDRVSMDSIDDMRVTPQEVDTLLREGTKLAPALSRTRILRAYAGVRPLVATDDDPSGRNLSRGIVCIDHATRDGLEGFITITGGKMMTYRLMAEQATNLACLKLGVNTPCTTATEPLPGSKECNRKQHTSATAQKAARGRHGALAKELTVNSNVDTDALVCECEHVSVSEVNMAIDTLNVKNLSNLRRRTRMGMGTCQGTLCAARTAEVMCRNDEQAANVKNDLASFANERWKGMQPVAWGESLAEAQLMATIYQGLCGLDQHARKEESQNEV